MTYPSGNKMLTVTIPCAEFDNFELPCKTLNAYPRLRFSAVYFVCPTSNDQSYIILFGGN